MKHNYCNLTGLMEASKVDAKHTIYSPYYWVEGHTVKYYKAADVRECIGIIAMRFLECEVVTYMVPVTAVKLQPVHELN